MTRKCKKDILNRRNKKSFAKSYKVRNFTILEDDSYHANGSIIPTYRRTG